MAERKGENLRELFENFVGPEQARQAADDVRQVEQILEENPAPEPSEEVQWQIKERICQALEKKRRSRRYWMPAYRAVAVAAVIIFVFVVSLELFKRPTELPRERPGYADSIPAAVWEGSDMVEDDAELAVLYAEIEQMEDDFLTVQLDQGYGNGGDNLTELELELMEINSEFWERIEI